MSVCPGRCPARRRSNAVVGRTSSAGVRLAAYYCTRRRVSRYAGYRPRPAREQHTRAIRIRRELYVDSILYCMIPWFGGVDLASGIRRVIRFIRRSECVHGNVFLYCTDRLVETDASATKLHPQCTYGAPTESARRRALSIGVPSISFARSLFRSSVHRVRVPNCSQHITQRASTVHARSYFTLRHLRLVRTVRRASAAGRR